MLKKIKILLIILLVSMLSLGGLAAQAAGPFFQIDAPTPDGSPTPTNNLEESEIGNSDGITFWGLIIIAVILLPMLILRKEW